MRLRGVVHTVVVASRLSCVPSCCGVLCAGVTVLATLCPNSQIVPRIFLPTSSVSHADEVSSRCSLLPVLGVKNYGHSNSSGVTSRQ